MSTLAVLLALSGTAYAAATITGRDVRNSSLTGGDVRNGSLSGADLRNRSVTGADVRRGSLRATHFARGDLPAGAPGAPGVRGPAGPQGAPGPVTGVLPSGVTLRGVFGIAARAGANSSVQTPISYGLALRAGPTFHYVGGGPTSECPGDENDPQALPGHLCVYPRATEGVTSVIIDDPADPRSSRFGAIVQGNVGGAETDVVVKGTWAVTAP